MMRQFLILCLVCSSFSVANAQEDVLQTAQKTNDYFMTKYSDPTQPTNVNKIRPSSLWTRAVYYEGLMALYNIDPQQRYIDYTDQWASFHHWTPRNGIKTCDADDQCCGQTYVERFMQSGGDEKIIHVIENLDLQMKTVNKKADNALYGWWTWIDAIQMAMPLYLQVSKVTGKRQYTQHAMRMYCWSRDTLAGGLFNEKEGLWWRDKDFVPPYKEKDGKNCYWSRGNGWVYAALVRSMIQMPTKDKYYKQLKKDFVLMSEALLKCQHADGFWRASLLSDVDYPDPEMTGTALFLYGMAWGIQQGILKEKKYRAACDRAWNALKTCIHPNGFLGWNQGTGKDPSAGQPVTFTSVPDFEDYGTGCYLLGLTEYYKLLIAK